MGIINKIIHLRTVPGLERVCREILYIWGCDIPPEVKFGRNVHFAHRGIGVVLYPRVEIGNSVTIYHGVTIGRARQEGPVGMTRVGDRAVLSTGAVITIGVDDRTIGEGAIIGANAVVTKNVPAWEIWAGVPARKVGERPRSSVNGEAVI